MILLNDIFTALNGVVMKKTLLNCSVNKLGVLFHNSWIGSVPLTHAQLLTLTRTPRDPHSKA